MRLRVAWPTLANLVNGADVRMIQRCGNARLAQQAGPKLTLRPQAFGKKLERHGTSQSDVFRPVDGSHAALTELGHHAVTTLAWHHGDLAGKQACDSGSEGSPIANALKPTSMSGRSQFEGHGEAVGQCQPIECRPEPISI